MAGNQRGDMAYAHMETAREAPRAVEKLQGMPVGGWRSEMRGRASGAEQSVLLLEGAGPS